MSTGSPQGSAPAAAARAMGPPAMAQTPAIQLSRRQLAGTIGGVLLGMLLAAIDQTIVSTALPRIVSDLGGLDQLAWVVSAYMLTSTAGVPVWGRLSDIFGRRWFYIAGMAVFLLGSALVGLSQSMEQLIAFRAIQGLGGGVMFSLSFAIVSDFFPPRERGKWQGLFGGTFALASIIGPLAGGTLTDHAGWRWAFFINLPIGAVALGVIWTSMPAVRPSGARPVIDWLGVGALVAGIVPLLLALSLAGRQFAWDSGMVVGLLIASAALVAAFVLVESRAKNPILPLYFFKNRIYSVSMISVFVTGVSMFGSIIFIPLFVQGVIGASATNSGLILTPMMLSTVAGSTLSGQFIARTGRYRALAVLGPALMSVGMFLLTRVDVDTSRPTVIRDMVISGFGLGITFPLFLIAVQNAFSYQVLGAVTSSVQFFRQIGGTLGVAVLGSILNTRLTDALGKNVPAEVAARLPPGALGSPESLVNPEALEKVRAQFAALGPDGPALFDTFHQATRVSLADAISTCFLIAFGFAVAAVITGFFVKEIKLRASYSEPVEGASGEEKAGPPAGGPGPPLEVS